MSEPRPVGRPTTYDPSFCEKVIEWGRLGKSKAWMAAELGTTRKTFYEWEAANPQFRDALECAMELAQQWWEDAGQNALGTREFQASVWSRSMAARFPKDWREKQAVVGGDENDAPVQIVSTDADAFARRIAGLASSS